MDNEYQLRMGLSPALLSRGLLVIFTHAHKVCVGCKITLFISCIGYHVSISCTPHAVLRIASKYNKHTCIFLDLLRNNASQSTKSKSTNIYDALRNRSVQNCRRRLQIWEPAGITSVGYVVFIGATGKWTLNKGNRCSTSDWHWHHQLMSHQNKLESGPSTEMAFQFADIYSEI